MKKLLCTATFILLAGMVWSQTKPVKIVFDINSRDTLVHKTALRHVTLMASSYPESQFEVVVYGSALPMVLSHKSTIEKGVSALAENKNVSFKVCAITMERRNIDKGQLLPGVDVVPDAIIEIVSKQAEGWGYIKE